MDNREASKLKLVKPIKCSHKGLKTVGKSTREPLKGFPFFIGLKIILTKIILRH